MLNHPPSFLTSLIHICVLFAPNMWLTLPSADAPQLLPTPLPSRHTLHPTPVLVNRFPPLDEKNRLRQCGSRYSLVRCCRCNRDDEQTTMQRSMTQSVKVNTNKNIPQGPQQNSRKPKGKKTPHGRPKQMEITRRQSKSADDDAATERRAELARRESQHSHIKHKKEKKSPQNLVRDEDTA